MDEIAGEHKCPVSQVALNWSTQKDFVGTALVGVRSEAHADENCAAFAWELSEAGNPSFGQRTGTFGIIRNRNKYSIYSIEREGNLRTGFPLFCTPEAYILFYCHL